MTARGVRETPCERFERWLDAGASAGGEDAASAHAAECPRCREAWDASRALDALLADPAAVAPAGFTDRLMRRVAASPRPTGSLLPALEDPLPWWVRVAMQPSAALAALLAALLVWKWSEIQDLAQAATTWTGGGPAAFVTHTLAALGSAFGSVAAGWAAPEPTVRIGLWLALLPALLVLSVPLARWGERLASWGREPTLH